MNPFFLLRRLRQALGVLRKRMSRIRGLFPFRQGHARPAEVNGRQSRDCKGRDVWLEVNGSYKGSKADSERYQVSTGRR